MHPTPPHTTPPSQTSILAPSPHTSIPTPYSSSLASPPTASSVSQQMRMCGGGSSMMMMGTGGCQGGGQGSVQCSTGGFSAVSSPLASNTVPYGCCEPIPPHIPSHALMQNSPYALIWVNGFMLPLLPCTARMPPSPSSPHAHAHTTHTSRTQRTRTRACMHAFTHTTSVHTSLGVNQLGQCNAANPQLVQCNGGPSAGPSASQASTLPGRVPAGPSTMASAGPQGPAHQMGQSCRSAMSSVGGGTSGGCGAPAASSSCASASSTRESP